MRNERNANAALAATRAINGQSAIARARAAEARRSRNPRTINCLVPFFILAATAYAAACVFLPVTL